MNNLLQVSLPTMDNPYLDEDPHKLQYLVGNFNAREWAEAFMSTFPDVWPVVDEGTMLAWFANAIMAGYDTATKIIKDTGIIT